MGVLVAVEALKLVRLIFLVFVALSAVRIPVLAHQREPGLNVMVKRGFFPVRWRMAFFAYHPQFFFMGIVFLMTILANGIYGFVLSVSMALLAGRLYVLTLEPVPLILRGVVVK